jgi:hypothetical protein
LIMAILGISLCSIRVFRSCWFGTLIFVYYPLLECGLLPVCPIITPNPPHPQGPKTNRHCERKFPLE